MSTENKVIAVNADNGTVATVTAEDFAQTVENITFDDILSVIRDFGTDGRLN